MGVDLFTEDDMNTMMAPKDAGLGVLVPPQKVSVAEAIGHATKLAATKEGVCPRCTEPFNEDRFLLKRSDSEHVLCSMICAIKHDRRLGTGYNSSIVPLKSPKTSKMSGRF